MNLIVPTKRRLPAPIESMLAQLNAASLAGGASLNESIILEFG